jgi:hypothetical protein
VLIFPAIDLRGGQCVRMRHGDYSREVAGLPGVHKCRRTGRRLRVDGGAGNVTILDGPER